MNTSDIKDFFYQKSLSLFGASMEQLCCMDHLLRNDVVIKLVIVLAERAGLYKDNHFDPKLNFINFFDNATCSQKDKGWFLYGNADICCENASQGPSICNTYREKQNAYIKEGYDFSAFTYASFLALYEDEISLSGHCTGNCDHCNLIGECDVYELRNALSFYYKETILENNSISFSNSILADIANYYLEEYDNYISNERKDTWTRIDQLTRYRIILQHVSFFELVYYPPENKDFLSSSWEIITFYHPHFLEIYNFLSAVKDDSIMISSESMREQLLQWYSCINQTFELFSFYSENGYDFFNYSYLPDVSGKGMIFTFFENENAIIPKLYFAFSYFMDIVEQCWMVYQKLSSASD